MKKGVSAPGSKGHSDDDDALADKVPLRVVDAPLRARSVSESFRERRLRKSDAQSRRGWLRAEGLERQLPRALADGRERDAPARTARIAVYIAVLTAASTRRRSTDCRS